MYGSQTDGLLTMWSSDSKSGVSILKNVDETIKTTPFTSDDGIPIINQ
jgi:hypothetical protein